MREHFGIRKAIAPPVSVLPHKNGKHLGVKPVNDAVLLTAATAPAPRFQRHMHALALSHLQFYGIESVIHSTMLPFYKITASLSFPFR
jgi:hypothetical protein